MARADLMRLGDLLQGLATVPAAAQEICIAGLAADSRAVQPGFLFVALPGNKADGRAFIGDAVRAGAAAILTTSPYDTVVPVAVSDAPRAAIAHAAARFYHHQPEMVVAVTGTNGKTSVVNFARQIWQQAGLRAASLGTLGLCADGFPARPSLTTPDPVSIHALLAEIAAAGIDHLALEASSHGLDQQRLDGLEIQAAAFTNLTRDHLDYHGTMEAYFAAKARVFRVLLPHTGAAVLNLDAPEVAALLPECRARGQELLGFGRDPAAALRLMALTPQAEGQRLKLEILGRAYDFILPLAGAFQVSNVLAALGLVIGAGLSADRAVATLGHLHGVRGRLERVATTPCGGSVYVDYAHTPDALETVLKALRAHTTGRLVVLFGCGGDRDPGKRPLMGAAASRWADHAILTDDNPRNEEPDAIRRAAAAGCSGSWEEIGDRGTAIRHGIATLAAGDVLVIAGKGHEQGQIIGELILPFDDASQARDAIALMGEVG